MTPIRKTDDNKSTAIIAVQTARETAEGLRSVLGKLEDMSATLIRFTTKHESIESTLKELVKDIRGGEGQDSMPTRMRLLEEGRADNRADIKVINERIDALYKRFDDADKEKRSVQRQLWLAVLGIAASLSLVIVEFVLGRVK